MTKSITQTNKAPTLKDGIKQATKEYYKKKLVHFTIALKTEIMIRQIKMIKTCNPTITLFSYHYF